MSVCSILHSAFSGEYGWWETNSCRGAGPVGFEVPQALHEGSGRVGPAAGLLVDKEQEVVCGSAELFHSHRCNKQLLTPQGAVWPTGAAADDAEALSGEVNY